MSRKYLALAALVIFFVVVGLMEAILLAGVPGL
jgi:hypothetical protein